MADPREMDRKGAKGGPAAAGKACMRPVAKNIPAVLCTDALLRSIA